MNIDFSCHVSYSEESESGIVWNRPQYFKGSPNYSRVGKKAGFKNKSNKSFYWYIRLNGIDYPVHRIVWILHNGLISREDQIDHVDRNSLNNKIENLRLVTASENCRNKNRRLDNKTGFTGVYFCTTKTGEGYQAYISESGRKVSKFFSVLKYGKEKALSLAVLWRNNKLKELDYSEGHGG